MSKELGHHPLFAVRTEYLSVDERVSLSYQRTRLVMQTYNLSASDVEHCSPRYWSMMSDPAVALDAATFTLLNSIGLTIGTIVRHLDRRPDLVALVDRILRCDILCVYIVSERGHGLDSFNMETTATKTPQGYVINTPREEACKFMPPSTPSFGVPKVALVLARLMVNGENRGLRFFIVPLCNVRKMFKGVESIRLGHRSTFRLLASTTCSSHAPPWLPPTWMTFRHPRFRWKLGGEIWRIPVGTMTVAAPWIPSLKIIAFIAGKYSMYRSLTGKGKGSEPIPIISFRTQQWPVLHAIAVSVVLQNWFSVVASQATNRSLDPRVRHGLSVIAKATVCRQVRRCVSEVSERCGAQGTFKHNFMARVENDIKGGIIADGDVLTLSIRLFSELLLQRYQIPLPEPSESLLAQHAASLFEENKTLLKQPPGGHRGQAYNGLVLPQAEHAIEAVGHSMAYSAGIKSGLPKPILDIYECAVIRRDPAWYAVNGGLTRHEQRVREDRAATSALPHLGRYLEGLDIEAYVSASIVSDAAWKTYYNGLSAFKGNAEPDFDWTSAKL